MASSADGYEPLSASFFPQVIQVLPIQVSLSTVHTHHFCANCHVPPLLGLVVCTCSKFGGLYKWQYHVPHVKAYSSFLTCALAFFLCFFPQKLHNGMTETSSATSAKAAKVAAVKAAAMPGPSNEQPTPSPCEGGQGGENSKPAPDPAQSTETPNAAAAEVATSSTASGVLGSEVVETEVEGGNNQGRTQGEEGAGREGQKVWRSASRWRRGGCMCQLATKACHPVSRG